MDKVMMVYAKRIHEYNIRIHEMEIERNELMSKAEHESPSFRDSYAEYEEEHWMDTREK